MTGSPFYGNAHIGFKEQLLLNPELHESPWNELHVTSVTMTGQTVPRAWAPTETFRYQANCQNQLCQNSREHLEIYINQANAQRLLKLLRKDYNTRLNLPSLLVHQCGVSVLGTGGSKDPIHIMVCSFYIEDSLGNNAKYFTLCLSLEMLEVEKRHFWRDP